MDKTFMYMIFVIVLLLLFWAMPNKKIDAIRKLITSVLQVLPISKIAEAFMVCFSQKKQNNDNS